MLLHTAEMRWFFDGRPPENVMRWFGTDRLGDPEERTDHYLILKNWTTVGVKLRGGDEAAAGSFDVKAIQGSPEIVHLNDRVSGYMDLWVKWADNRETIAPWLNSLLADGEPWCRVDKVRWLRMVSLGGREPRDVSSPPASGCGIELSHIETAAGAAWSFSFEAFGPLHALRANLLASATWFFDRHPSPLPLSFVDSYAYPTWLNTLYDGDR